MKRKLHCILAVSLLVCSVACKNPWSKEKPLTLTGITAVYSSTNAIFPDTNLYTLRAGLTVTGNYTGGFTKTLTDYTLSGGLTTGESVITVRYQGRTTTFKVTVETSHSHSWSGWVTTIPPTFIEQGEETNSCSATPSHIDIRPIDPLTITTTADWNNARTQLNGKTGNYTLTIGGTFPVSGSTSPTFGTTADGSTLVVTLKGTGKLYLTSHGNIIRLGANQTLIIDSAGLTLEGLKNGQNGSAWDNNQTVLYVGGFAKLELRNGTIRGNNTSSSGGGVVVNGSFTMSGGTISGNTASDNGGGVYVGLVQDSDFTMTGGTISGNTAIGHGGGVYVNGIFTMTGGEISGNSTPPVRYGGGVYSRGTFRIVTGIVYGSDGGALSNVSSAGTAALYLESGTAQRGTFSGASWVSQGNLTTSNNTIKVLNGDLVPYP